MKLNKVLSWLFVGLMAISASMLTSCEDQPDKFELTGGVPTVNYIRMPYLSQADSLLDKASLSSVICLVGNNLTSIKELYFNDQKAQLNTSYITDHALIVQIPATIPTDVTDKIYMVTRDGEKVDYDFHVVVPAPNPTSMSCEYAKPGSEVTFYGNYFVDDPNVPLKVTCPDGTEVTEFKSVTQSAISFILPESCNTEGAFKMETVYGESETPFHYLDSRGMLFDFDTPWDGTAVLGNHGWHERTIKSDDTSLKGNYMQLGDGTAKLDDSSWGDGDFAFQYWAGSWDTPQNITSGDGVALYNVADFTHFKDMSLKFEMCIPNSNPWSACAMQLLFQGFDQISISGNPIDGFDGTVAAANNSGFNGEGKNKEHEFGRAMYKPWAATGSYDTGGKWITVTIPLSSFNLTKTGAASTYLPSKPEDFASFTMFVNGTGGTKGTECKPIIKIDNIRVVPNK